MRYDKQVYFVKSGVASNEPDEYGNFPEPEEVKTLVYAHVSDTGTERMQALYGSLNQSAKTVRLRNAYSDSFDHIEIDGRPYQVGLSRDYRHKSVFEVSRV